MMHIQADSSFVQLYENLDSNLSFIFMIFTYFRTMHTVYIYRYLIFAFYFMIIMIKMIINHITFFNTLIFSLKFNISN